MSRASQLPLVSNGDVWVHYRHPLARSPKPFCEVNGWEDIKWIYDDGVGARFCKRCVKLNQERIDRYKTLGAVNRKRLYARHAETEKEYARKYTRENRHAINIRRKMTHRRKVDEAIAQKRLLMESNHREPEYSEA